MSVNHLSMRRSISMKDNEFLNVTIRFATSHDYHRPWITSPSSHMKLLRSRYLDILDSVSSSDFLKNMNSALLYKLQTLLIMSTFDLLSSAVTLMARFSLTANSYLQLL